MSIEIFVSYTWSKEKNFNAVKQFADKLEKKLKIIDSNISIFYDKDNITSNAHKNYFKPILESHLNNSKILLVLLSPDWLHSEWCNWEFRMFNSSNRPIIPVLWNKIDHMKFKNILLDIEEKVIKANHISFINQSEDEYTILVETIIKSLSS